MFDATPGPGRGYGQAMTRPDPAPLPAPSWDHTPEAELRLQDAALLKAASGGDARAGRTLADQNLAPLIARVERLTRDRAEAEDIAQESFLRLWGAAADWQPRARISTWLTMVAQRLAIDRLRRTGRFSDAEPPDLPDPAPSPERLASAREAGRAMEEALSALPDRQRTAFVLVHVDGLSGRDAAATLDLSEDALESLLARARRGLRGRLAAHLDSNPAHG
jgi:RNA polymerase sigma-70 factor (ECF subfamily)